MMPFLNLGHSVVHRIITYNIHNEQQLHRKCCKMNKIITTAKRKEKEKENKKTLL